MFGLMCFLPIEGQKVRVLFTVVFFHQFNRLCLLVLPVIKVEMHS